MGNKIFIQIMTNENGSSNFGTPLVFPLVDDINLKIESSFASYSGMVGILDTIKNISLQLGSAGGQASEGSMDFWNQFDLPRWEKTDPIILNPKLIFYIGDLGGFYDVLLPMQELIGLTIPSKNESGKYTLPGVSLSTAQHAKLDKATSERVDDTVNKGSKLIAVKIPGVIHLKYALLKRAIPTFSKHLDSDGFPIWGTLDTEIMSLAPATSEMLELINQGQYFSTN